MDISTLTSLLTDHFVVVIFAASLIVGYIIKNTTIFKKVPNDDIPAILAVFGGILNCSSIRTVCGNGCVGSFYGIGVYRCASGVQGICGR